MDYVHVCASIRFRDALYSAVGIRLSTIKQLQQVDVHVNLDRQFDSRYFAWLQTHQLVAGIAVELSRATTTRAQSTTNNMPAV